MLEPRQCNPRTEAFPLLMTALRLNLKRQRGDQGASQKTRVVQAFKVLRARCSLRQSAGVRIESIFPARVEKEKHYNNHQQDNLPENKHRRIKAAEFIASVQVDNERAEADAADEPDDLPLRIPHRFGASSFN